MVFLFIAFTSPALTADAPNELTYIDWTTLSAFLPPPVSAPSAILVDVTTGFVLYARGEHIVRPAASLTKVFAIHAALEAVNEGLVDQDEQFVPPPETWAENQAPGSSLMFLGPNQSVTVRELLPGLAIASGNDAALALALRVSGSVGEFVERMNRVARQAGLISSSFVEPSGLDPRNMITAAEYARFVMYHLWMFPELPRTLYSMPTFTYPKDWNVTSDEPAVSIRQNNRNLLIGSYPGADGIKTGFIDESGYHLAATAERSGRRLIAIVLGVQASSHEEGGRLRAQDARALLDYGFDSFESLEFGVPELGEVSVYKGRTRRAVPTAPEGITVTIPSGTRDRLGGQVNQVDAVLAPMPADTVIGSIRVTLDGVILKEVPITVGPLERGGFFRRMWDSLRLLFRRLRRETPPMTMQSGP